MSRTEKAPVGPPFADVMGQNVVERWKRGTESLQVALYDFLRSSCRESRASPFGITTHSGPGVVSEVVASLRCGTVSWQRWPFSSLDTAAEAPGRGGRDP